MLLSHYYMPPGPYRPWLSHNSAVNIRHRCFALSKRCHARTPHVVTAAMITQEPAAATNMNLGMTFPSSYYDGDGRLMLKNLTRSELADYCIAAGESEKRALHLWRWMYDDGRWMRSLDETATQQNGFGQGFRDAFNPCITVDGGLKLRTIATAADGTRKLVFELVGGEASGGTVETVLIPVVRQQGQKPRITICVSSQVGCAMNCQFCYTGRMGLLGNLTPAQIVEQVVFARRLLHEERIAAGEGVTPLTTATNIVMMGTGEPFHNLDAVLAALSIFTDPLGLHFSHNKITVSTVGLVPELRRFAAASNAQLAVSLHAPTDEIRDWIVPVNRRWPLADLLQTLEHLYPRVTFPVDHQSNLHASHLAPHAQGSTAAARKDETAPHQGPPPAAGHQQEDREHGTGRGRRRHVLFEYVMLKGVNDTPELAHELLRVTHNIEAKFNLIVFNPHQGTRFRASTAQAVAAFRSVLIQGGRVCTVRDSRGDDQMAACGQLGDLEVTAAAGRTPAPILEPPASLVHVLDDDTGDTFRM